VRQKAHAGLLIGIWPGCGTRSGQAAIDAVPDSLVSGY